MLRILCCLRNNHFYQRQCLWLQAKGFKCAPTRGADAHEVGNHLMDSFVRNMFVSKPLQNCEEM